MSQNKFDFSGKTAAPLVKGSIREGLQAIGIQYDRLGINAGSLPFAAGDVTAGSESEMQTIVKGGEAAVDLPSVIEQSNYMSNIRRRIKSGDASIKMLTDLEKHINVNTQGIWENSWVRFPLKRLGGSARTVLDHDLLKNKNLPEHGKRSDLDRFFYFQNQEDCLRLPVSYLLKLSLAEMLNSPYLNTPRMQRTAKKCLEKFLNDNTSPETSSLYVIVADETGSIGLNTASEMAVRYLLGQVLIEYASSKYALRDSGQDVRMFFSPHPPVRQKKLSHCISDSFYRDLFMNPCLSGWNHGEEKAAYMHLCHRVLSRSQINAVLKLREAGIITSNLVSLPNLCNISLANNGTHVSLGSSKLSALLADPLSGYTSRHEKYFGDLVVKIVEHFLPLFVGTYTAAPYRLGFTDFHPEKALGFLPHELDYTHLRMLWRRWKKKADLSILGYKMTPFGPLRIDRTISKVFRLRGDFVSDIRLIDYLMALLSTDESPSLNGQINNHLRLKQDLADLGVFDVQMSLYLFDKLREFGTMGFSGFEGRHYSLFESFTTDMARAVDMQNLLYLLAFKYIASGRISHESIPDSPFVESERRQIIFGRAIGLPTFFVHKNTQNTFLKNIIEKTGTVRPSKRYGGYIRIFNDEYCLTLLNTLRRDAADLIEMLDLKDSLTDLESRITDPDHQAASGKITRGVLEHTGGCSPMRVDPDRFNLAAEEFYRTTLRKQHLEEAFDLLKLALTQMKTDNCDIHRDIRRTLHAVQLGNNIDAFVDNVRRTLLQGETTTDELEKLTALILTCVASAEDRYEQSRILFNGGKNTLHEASIH